MSREELEEDVTALLDQALEQPREGLAMWSFHTKDRPVPLEIDEIVARLESGKGVYVIELVFDEDLELFQRGDGKKLKSHRELKAFKGDRVDALIAASAPPLAKAALPMQKAARAGPVHGALLGKSLGEAKKAKKTSPRR